MPYPRRPTFPFGWYKDEPKETELDRVEITKVEEMAEAIEAPQPADSPKSGE